MTRPYDVPDEMRDFAERSVAQARKAFEGFMGAVHKAAETVDGTTGTMTSTARDASSKAVDFAEQNVAAAFDLATRMVHARSLEEVLKLQSEFVQSQMAAIQQQTAELGAAVKKASGIDPQS